MEVNRLKAMKPLKKQFEYYHTEWTNGMVQDYFTYTTPSGRVYECDSDRIERADWFAYALRLPVIMDSGDLIELRREIRKYGKRVK